MARLTVASPGVAPHHAARIAGLGLLLMVPLAMFAFIAGFESLVVPSDAAETVRNILAFEERFRLAIASFLVVVFLDVLVAWGLYVLLEPVNRAFSMLVAWLRLAYAAVLCVAVGNLFSVIQLLERSRSGGLPGPDALDAQVMMSIHAFSDVWNVGLAIFGGHLVALGGLFLKSGYIPRPVSALVILAGLGYLAEMFGKILIPEFAVPVVLYTFIGEVLLIFWLLFKLGRSDWSASPAT